jgi:SprT protein
MNATDRCVQEIIEAFEIARKELGIVSKLPRIKWDLRGTTAGKAYYRENLIRLNPVLLQNNEERFINRTPKHEAAHLIAFLKHGGLIKPHGPEWQRVCWALGIPATRCHSYDVSAVTGRKPVGICQEII